LYTLYHLRSQFNLDVSKIAKGIKDIKKLTYFIGRWSIIRESPKVIYDSAHNIAGVQYLVKHVQKMKFHSLKLVWGTTKEKDVDHILALLPKEALYYFCQAQNSRAMDAEKLRMKAAEYGLHGYAYTTVKVAYQVALTEADPNDLIVVAGSSFVIAEVV
jgi:dihydrofolate synthase/folylpolyglutamate synthase